MATINAYVPDLIKATAQSYADEKRRSVSWVVAQALARYLVEVGAIPIVGELTPDMDWREIERRLDAAKEKQGE
jgi:hypothetical protein